MLWRVPSLGRHWDTVKGERNRKSFRNLVEKGQAFGCLAWVGDEPVGWCAVGPREHYPYLQRSRTIPVPAVADTWCVSCFFVARAWRARGIAGRLLNAALDYAELSGAAALEGYPTVPKNVTNPVPAAFAHTGVPRLFEAAGFEWICDTGARQVWRRRFARTVRRRR